MCPPDIWWPALFAISAILMMELGLGQQQFLPPDCENTRQRPDKQNVWGREVYIASAIAVRSASLGCCGAPELQPRHRPLPHPRALHWALSVVREKTNLCLVWISVTSFAVAETLPISCSYLFLFLLSIHILGTLSLNMWLSFLKSDL